MWLSESLDVAHSWLERIYYANSYTLKCNFIFLRIYNKIAKENSKYANKLKFYLEEDYGEYYKE